MIKLIYENDTPVWVEPNRVTHVLGHQSGLTVVQVADYGPIMVKDTPEAVVKFIEASQPVRGFFSSIFN